MKHDIYKNMFFKVMYIVYIENMIPECHNFCNINIKAINSEIKSVFLRGKWREKKIEFDITI